MMIHVVLVILMLQQVPTLGNSSSSLVNNSSSLAPALYVFGDSMLDSGNNNLLPTLAKANFKPYGINFVQGRPTGRFTNGRTVADFIAEFLGLPYSPPYLSMKMLVNPGKLQQLGGLNFASGSCGILPQTGSTLGKCLNLDEQIELFGKRVKQDVNKKNRDYVDEVSKYLAKSMFVISVGSNDYINNYLDTQHFDTSKRYTPQSYAKLLIDRLSQQLKRLYELGARKLLVFEIGPVGCIPWITRRTEHEGQCVEEINEIVVMFNDHLAPMLLNLTSTLPSSAFVLGRAHSLGYDAAINPSNYGLKDSRKACCVTWLNGSSGCIPGLGAWACRHPEQNYFWDGYHLTETLYRIIATRCFYGPSLCTPFNIKYLLSL